MITLFIFLIASALQVARDAGQKAHFDSWLVGAVTATFFVSAAGLLIAFFSCLWSVQSVLRPRGARHYKSPTTGTDLLWQEHVVAHGSGAAYFEAVKMAQSELLLKNLTDQVFELAHISKEKMAGLHAARRACWLGFCCWIVLVTSSLILLRLK
jgi:hypothetical protein